VVTRHVHYEQVICHLRPARAVAVAPVAAVIDIVAGTRRVGSEVHHLAVAAAAAGDCEMLAALALDASHYAKATHARAQITSHVQAAIKHKQGTRALEAT
jgi:hypothetical protein